MNLVRHIEAELRHAGVLAPGAVLLAAASGGRDSSVLAHALARLTARWKARLVLAHVHHGLRAEADADRDAVRRLADDLGALALWRPVPLRADLEAHGGSVQDRARVLRYDALEDMGREAGACCVLTAHHAEDQAETVLLALLRASGAAGLAGIDAVRRVPGRLPVLRPLLDVAPRHIAEYAAVEGVAWVEDASNARDDYRRNALRHHVLPALRDIAGEGAFAAIGTSARIASETAVLLDRRAEECVAALTAGGALRHGPLGARLALPPMRTYLEIECSMLLRRVLTHCGAPSGHEAVRAVSALRTRNAGARVALGEGWMCVREGEDLVVCRPPVSWPPVTVTARGALDTPAGRFSSETVPVNDMRPESLRASGPATAYIDLDAAGDAWTLRPWRAGDRFQPLGGAGGRKVSDALTDARVPSALRAAHPVLERDGRIIWVCGVRLDAHARLTADTRRMARITWNPTPWP